MNRPWLRRLLGRGDPAAAIGGAAPGGAADHSGLGHEDLRPGSVDYDAHVREEVDHYTRVFESEEAHRTLTQPVPPSWHEVEERASRLIEVGSGATFQDHMIQRLTRREGIRAASLGCGAGGVEIPLVQASSRAVMTCFDLNENLMGMGRARARELGLDIEFAYADLNTIDLPAETFDVVLCHASLHHVLELERLAEQVRRSLKPGGDLVTVDVITRNGYLLWPESREVVTRLFRTLPERFRMNHTAYPERRIDAEIWEADTSASGMECVRSEDILPVLRSTFEEIAFVPYFAIARRFFATMYGPNYNLDQLLDRSLFEWIWQLDRHYLESGALKPETFFGIYRRAGS